eukprot:920334_1
MMYRPGRQAMVWNVPLPTTLVLALLMITALPNRTLQHSLCYEKPITQLQPPIFQLTGWLSFSISSLRTHNRTPHPIYLIFTPVIVRYWGYCFFVFLLSNLIFCWYLLI